MRGQTDKTERAALGFVRASLSETLPCDFGRVAPQGRRDGGLVTNSVRECI